MEEINVSIIICTRNRADKLRQTLASLAELEIPDNFRTELIIVDNGSTDGTAEVIWSFHAPRLPLRLISEPQPGLSRARNAGLKTARGDVILFTDDDVRVPPGWVERMSAPIRSGGADAVAGGVVLASHLQRDWMNSKNTGVLAETKGIDPAHPERTVGANMAFARYVLEKVPAFDPDLDAGSPMGLGGDTLFSNQVRQAGFRIVSAFDVVIEHHCDPERLSRTAYRTAWKRVGRSQAYIAYHWRHDEMSRLEYYRAMVHLWPRITYKYLTDWNAARQKEGSPPWECVLLTALHYAKQLFRESGRPRNYERYGLQKKPRGHYA